MIQRSLILFSFFFSLPLWGSEAPFFAGNVIAFSGENTDPGHYYGQIFIYYTRFNGSYNQNSRLIADRNVHQTTFELDLSWGLFENVDITCEFYGYQVHNNETTSYEIGDVDAFFGFQLLKQQKNSYVPNIRWLVGGTFPTGKYDNLDPLLRLGDGVGSGAFSTFLGFISSKTFHGRHPINLNVNIFYLISSTANVSGKSIYTDDPLARGEVKPGVEFEVDVAFEYKFNQPWGCGFELFFLQQNSSSFRNKSEASSSGDTPSSYLLSAVPTIEYNFNADASMIAGAWFSVAGREELAFRSFVFAIYKGF